MTRLINRIWYRWMLRKYRIGKDYTAALWNHARNGWIYPDGTFISRRADYK